MASYNTRAELHVPDTADTKEGWSYLYANIPLLVVCAAVVAFRVWWRCIKHHARRLTCADVCCVVGLVLNVIQVACVSIAIVQWGLGHHAPHLTPEQRYNSLLYLFVFQCLVQNTVGLSKLSLLFLYLDVFPQHSFRLICWGLIIHMSLGLFALNMTTMLQCQPVSFSWDKTLDGQCINIKAFWYAQSGWNTLMDVVVLLLPVPLVAMLPMNRRSRIGLLVVYLLGAFVCIASIERLISLDFNGTFAQDLTWATGTSVLWAQVESTVGIICACAPALRQPLASVLPGLFGADSDGPYRLSDTPRPAALAGHAKGAETSAGLVETSCRSEGCSAEDIVGIKRTVSVDVSYISRHGEPGLDGTTTYPEHQFERHIV
ncbi:integral membrane protein [Cordyceps militaris CM01]|uniref:Integral membrane protein n=1 Tax=Cordyceps militaris (strain CM01) TaxID=983644 RepID=G3JJG7_CORMM|nr:uncharacterized protein CCM_06215 [Cordyceps militaris CM01]EGX92055.1 integral membrane protein [Cordyceps militaris CM01]